MVPPRTPLVTSCDVGLAEAVTTVGESPTEVPMILMLSSLSAALAAPDFDAGSDGSYGPLLVTAGNTLQVTLPPDGVIRATDITVETGGVLRFQTNTNNTPVYLLAQGDIRIDGTLDIAGRPATADVGGFAGPGGWRY